MDIVRLKPASKRDWALLGIGAAVAILAILLMLPHYDYYPGRENFGLYRVNRWTGSVDYCASACGHVPDKTGLFE